MSRFDTTRVFWNPDVVSFFQEREFTSLLPIEYQTTKKPFLLPDITDITDADLLKQKLSLFVEAKKNVIIATSG